MVKNRFRLAFLPLISALLLLPPASFAQKISVEEIFTPDFIGADTAYLEHFTGPARVTRDNGKEYLLNGCRINTYTANGSIRALELTLSPKCSFDLNNFIAHNKENPAPWPANSLKFGDLPAPTTFFADCFGIACGNAFDPVIYEHYNGSRVENFIEVLASSTQASYGWTSQWAADMAEREGEDWMMYGQYNCDPYKHRKIAERHLTPDKIEKVMIGYDLILLKDLQQDCSETSFETGEDAHQ